MSVLLAIWLFSAAAGKWLAVDVIVFSYLSCTGQLILEKGPSCSDGDSVYSCTRSDGGVIFIWRFQPSGVRQTLLSDNSPFNVLVGSSTVLLAIIPSDSSTTATATIAYLDAVRLNGTTISCGTNTLNISVPDVTRSK